MDTQIVQSKAEGGQGKTFCRSLGGDGRYCRWGLRALVGSEAMETNIVLIFLGGTEILFLIHFLIILMKELITF